MNKLAEKVQIGTIDQCARMAFDDYIVVAATERLRHLIADRINRIQADSGKQCWETPKIHTFNGWLREVWAGLELTSRETLPALLSSSQTEAIWEQCISQHIRKHNQDGFEYMLWHVNVTASTAQTAYGIMQQYQIDAQKLSDRVSDDVENFLAWRERYLKWLNSKGYVDAEQLPEKILRFAPSLASIGHGKIVLAGFDPLTPQQLVLFEALRKEGVEMREICQQAPDISEVAFKRVDFETTDEEIRTCAQWARTVIESDPDRHVVAVAVPELRALHPRIRRAFSACTNPGDLLENRRPAEQAFHITLGERLSRIPLVADALKLVSMVGPEVETDTLCSVVMSDRIKGWRKEKAARARLANELRKRCGHWTTIADLRRLIRYLPAPRRKRLRRLNRLLGQAEAKLKAAPKTAEISHWARFFTDWISCFQSKSKGGRIFGTDEVLAHQQWGRIVENLAEFGVLGRKMRLTEAMAKLLRVAGSIDFQPLARHAPIQIGGPKALIGQNFTHIWIMGMNDEAIPGPARPNPFIPVAIQSASKVPHATPALVRDAVTRDLSALLTSSDHAVLSYAKSDKTRLHQPSSIISLRPAVEPSSLRCESYPGFRKIIAASHGEKEQFIDWMAPDVADPPSIRSGVRVLTDQSQCPFKAFAEHRLGLSRNLIDDFGSGLTAMERGLLMHALLNELAQGKWRAVEELTSDSMDEFQRDARQVADRLLTETNASRFMPVSHDVLENELERLVAIALNWRSEDAKRIRKAPFEIFDTEWEFETEVAGLPVRGRVDRIDKRASGHVVIDYKSSTHSAQAFTSERMQQAQVPVYAYALFRQNMLINALSYATVNSEHVKFSEYPGNMDQAVGFQAFLKSTFEKLEDLSQSFLRGEALADPIDNVCDYCSAAPVCRIGAIAELNEGKEQ